MNYFDNEKNYNTINNYYKRKYNKKVYKISLNAGFTCPNRDGSKDDKGCIYCSSSGSGEFAGDVSKSLRDQFFEVKEKMQHKWKEGLYISYLQAHSNTYHDVKTLEKIYREVLTFDSNIVGLSISTRCDCFSAEIYDLLSRINQMTDLTVEIGLQSIKESTTILINRRHSLREFEDCIEKLSALDIKVVVHIINGLPFETKEDMLMTCRYLNQFKLFGIKIHMLFILKHTPLELYFRTNPFPILSLGEFVEITVQQLRILNPEFILLRLTGDADPDDLIEPLWTKKKLVVLNEIDKYMRKHQFYQGDLYEV